MNERQIKDYLDRRIDDKLILIRNQLMKYIDDKLDKKIHENNNKQIVAVKDNVKREVALVVAREIQPQLDDAMEYMHFQTLDGTELVTEYRRRVSDQVKENRNLKRLTYGDKTDSGNKFDFGNSEFFFQDD